MFHWYFGKGHEKEKKIIIPLGNMFEMFLMYM